MKRSVSVKLPSDVLALLDELVASGVYKSRSHAVRVAVEELVKRDLAFLGVARRAGKVA